MGLVYDATDTRTGSRVAVKVLKDAHPRAIAGFKREFRALAGIHHPNLATLLELATEGDEWYLAMELVEGATFVDHARAGGEAVLREDLRQLTRALAHLHERGFVHRDVKPTNVIVEPSGRLVLLDFGLVQYIPDYRSDPGRFVVGTVDYIAPELVVVGGRLSPACDWYAVGVMIYECLTGCRPLTGRRYDVLRAKLDRDPPHPREVAPEAPADLADLCMRLLDRDPRGRARASEVQTVLGGRALSPSRRLAAGLIGRDHHLAALQGAAATAARGVPTAICVHGDSGMGKSALLSTFADRLVRAGDAEVLTARCYARESVPYKGLDAIVEGLAQRLSTLSPTETRRLTRGRGLEHAARLFPSLEGLPGVAPLDDAAAASEAHPQAQRDRAFLALRSLLYRVGSNQPLVLILDDAQWIDRDGAELLAALCAGPSAPPILVVLACRTSDLDSQPLAGLLSRLRQQRGELPEIQVAPLSPEDAAAMAEQLAGDAAASIAGLLSDCGGSPYLIGEVIRYLRSGNDGLAVPSLESVIGARLAALPEGAQALLEVLCVAGHPIEAATAIAAAGVDHGAEGLAALRAAHFIRGRPSRGGDPVEPYHDRIRESLVASLAPDQVRQHHRGLARALEADGAAAELIADHYGAAGERAEAARFTAVAAAAAARALAFDRAAELYREALAGPPRGGDRGELLRGLAEALAASGDSSGSASAYHEAADCVDGSLALELRSRAADQLLRSGRLADGVQAFRSVLAELGISTAATPRRALIAGLSRRAWLVLRGTRFRPRLGEPDERERLRVDTLYWVASGFALVDPMRAMEVQARHTLAALRLGEPVRLARALAGHAVPLVARGHRKRQAERILVRAEALADEHDDPHARGLAALVRGFGAYCAGEWPAAVESLTRCERLLDRDCAGATWELATCRFFLLSALARMGDYLRLAERGSEWLADARRRNDLHALSNLGTAEGFARLAQDDAAGAHSAVERAAANWDHSIVPLRRYRVLFMHANIHLYEGHYATAAAAVDEAWTSVRSALVDRIQEVRLSMWNLRAQARLELAARAGDAERRHQLRVVRRDLRAMEREGAPWALGLARLWRARVALLAGDRDRAVRLLEDAAERLDATAMRACAAAARRTLGSLVGGPPGQALIEAADEELAACGVLRPARMAAALAWAVDGDESAG